MDNFFNGVVCSNFLHMGAYVRSYTIAEVSNTLESKNIERIACAEVSGPLERDIRKNYSEKNVKQTIGLYSISNLKN